jgi:regulatory protein
MPREERGGRAGGAGRGRRNAGRRAGAPAGTVGASRNGAGSAGEGNEVERAKAAMLRLLSVRMRSRWELRSRLAGRRFSERALETALSDLERVGLVDDGKFARLFLESRVRRRPRSYSVLRAELRSRGVPVEIVESAIEEQRLEVSEEALARLALGHRAERMSATSPERARARAGRFLASKGFSRSIIEELLRELK